MTDNDRPIDAFGRHVPPHPPEILSLDDELGCTLLSVTPNSIVLPQTPQDYERAAVFNGGNVAMWATLRPAAELARCREQLALEKALIER